MISFYKVNISNIVHQKLKYRVNPEGQSIDEYLLSQ